MIRVPIIKSKQAENPAFSFVIELTGATTITLPLVTGYTHNFTVEWGDGASGTVTAYNDPDAAHNYTSAGIYLIKINGICESFYINNTNTIKSYLTEVSSWGVNINLKYANFYGCSKLSSLPNQKGQLSNILTFMNFFRSCSSLTYIPSGLFDNNTSVITFYYCFYNCNTISSLVPELWNYFPTADGTNCFSYCTKAVNYSEIPENWR